MEKKPVAAGKSSFDLIDRGKFFASIKVQPDTRILDLACGVGRYSLNLSGLLSSEGLIYAVDLWEEGIEGLKQSMREMSISNIKPVLGDITKTLPLDDGSVDLCLMATILHDLSQEKRRAVLRETARVVRPEGRLAVIEFKKIDKGPGPPVAIRLSGEEVEDIIRQNGFEKDSLIEIGEFNYMLTARKK